MRSKSVPGFLPSTSGLHFANDFSPGPVFRLGLGPARVPIGDASNGLCGGMVLLARDLYEQGSPAPPDTSPPSPGTSLFSRIARELLASWHLPFGPLRYVVWTARSDRSVARRTAGIEWPKIQAGIDIGRLCPLGVIRTKGLNPFRLRLNHQVLAYAYTFDEDTGAVELFVYDPNHPDLDDLAMRFTIADRPAASVPFITYLPDELPVRGFFLTD